MQDQNIISVFTDGSSLGNPGPGGFGAIIVYDEKVKELGGGEDHTTNNRMELSAAIGALKYIGETEKNIVIHTDSSYVMNGITKWVYGWRKNNWITSQKQEVLNRDLWEELLGLTAGRKIKWQYVGGHIGIPGNDRADHIAVAFASKGKSVELYDGPFAGYHLTNILDIGHDEGQKDARTKNKQHSKAKAFSYLSLVDGKAMRHATWAECEGRVKGKSAKYKKAISKEDEEKILKGWGARL